MEQAASPSSAPRSLIGENHLAELLAMAHGAPPGSFVEVGVYQGGSAWRLLQIARQQGRAMYCYDTFTGIPYKSEGDAHSVWDFADVQIERVIAALEGAIVVPGIFPKSAEGSPPLVPVAFAHLDCDQYQSVRESAIYLTPLMASGGVIWFDDSPCIPAAHRAAREIFGEQLRLSSDFGKHYVVMP